jgi:hypothetical protein
MRIARQARAAELVCGSRSNWLAPVVVGFGQPAERRARDATGVQRIAILRIGGQHAVEDLIASS